MEKAVLKEPLQSDRIPATPPRIRPVDGHIKRPLWSVMIPTYNCITFLSHAIKSVLAQAPGEDEMQIEVVDDFSTDGDVAALVQELGNGRVTYFRQKQNRGSLRNFETCINRAKGEWVHILHGDDKTEFGFYAEIQSLFTTYPTAGAAFTSNNYINDSGEVLFRRKLLAKEAGIIQDFFFKIAKFQLIEPPSIVVKRSAYEQLGSFFAVHYGEDWEMWTRIAARFPVAYSPKYLATYRTLQTVNITTLSFMSGQNVKDIIRVIDIIQEYLPKELRSEYKKLSLKYYSTYNGKAANGLYHIDTDAAFRQIKHTLAMDKNSQTIYLAVKLYLKYFFAFNKIKSLLRLK